MFSIFRLSFFGVPDSVSSFAVLQFAKMEGCDGHFGNLVVFVRINVHGQHHRVELLFFQPKPERNRFLGRKRQSGTAPARFRAVFSGKPVNGDRRNGAFVFSDQSGSAGHGAAVPVRFTKHSFCRADLLQYVPVLVSGLAEFSHVASAARSDGNGPFAGGYLCETPGFCPFERSLHFYRGFLAVGLQCSLTAIL